MNQSFYNRTRGGWWALGLLLAGVIITAFLARQEMTRATAAARQHFESVCAEAQTKLEVRLAAHAQILRSGAAFFADSDGVTRAEWREFAERQKITQQLPGIQGLGFARLIPRAQLAPHIQELRAEGFPDYRVKPEGERESYSSIVYLEPFTNRNLRAFGYDMLSEPVRRAAMERARDEDAAALSGKVILMQETGPDVQAGTLMYVPVYRTGAPHKTVAERRAALLGWVYSPYRMNDLIQGVFSRQNLAQEYHFRLKIFDDQTASPETLLYDSLGSGDKYQANAAGLTRQTKLDAAGHPWFLFFSELPGVGDSVGSRPAWWIMLGGTMVSLLLAGLVFSLANTRFHARRLAQQLTSDLRQSESLLKSVTGGTTDAIYVKDLQGRYLMFNPAASQMAGKPVEEVLDKDDTALFPAEQARKVMAEDRRVMESGVVQTYEEFVDTTTGPTTLLSTKGPVHDEQGRVTGLFGIARDITERKQAEAALKQSEAKYSRLVEGAPDIIYTFSSQRGGLYYSAHVEAVMGYSAKYLLEHPFLWQNSVEPADLETIRLALQQFATGEPFDLEYRIKDSTGRWHWLRDRSIGRRQVGEDIIIEGIATDITERKQAEAMLRLESAALEAAANAIVITDYDGNIEWVNAAFTAFTGYSSSEAVGQNPRLLKSGKHEPAFYKNLWDTVLACKVWRGEIINRRKDGSHYDDEMTITPLTDEHGKITHFIAVKQDITHRKELEAQFRQSQKMEAFGQLAGGVAHDFNNILAAMIMQVEMLGFEPLPAAVREGLTQIHADADRAARLTRQLLLFSRKQIFNPRAVDLNEVVANLVKMLRRLIGEHIALQFHPLPGAAPLRADPGMLEQLLLNLAVNARDAMPQGGQLDLRVEAIPIDATVAALHQAQPGPFFRLTVQDNGSGIPPEVLPRIYEPFYTTKDVGKGSGLGLAAVQGILAVHHGWIEVESRVGHGTTFQIYLPRLADGPKTAPESPAAALHASGGGKTILLVEDDSSFQKILTVALTRAGYIVLVAESAPAALALWSQQRATVALLLTDIVLPGGLSGSQLGSQLQQDQPALKVIYMSGFPRDSLGADLDLRDGVNFLAKPFTPAALAQALRNQLAA